jgi:hypothetical protein
MEAHFFHQEPSGSGLHSPALMPVWWDAKTSPLFHLHPFVDVCPAGDGAGPRVRQDEVDYCGEWLGADISEKRKEFTLGNSESASDLA